MRISTAIISVFITACHALGFSAQAEETLIAPVPDGFEVGFEASQDFASIREFVPHGETVHDWSRMITVQIFKGMTLKHPDDFAKMMSTSIDKTCSRAKSVRMARGLDNGYPYALWVMNCPLNPQTGKPEHFWIKALLSGTTLYSVQYAYRSEMTDELSQPPQAYLKTAILCDADRAEAPCPRQN